MLNRKEFIIDKIESILLWNKVPPLQEDRELWEKIIKNDIPTKFDDKTGALVYQFGEISSMNTEKGIKCDAYMR